MTAQGARFVALKRFLGAFWATHLCTISGGVLGLTVVRATAANHTRPPEIMATIRARKKADSTVSYTVQIRLKKKGVLVYQESQTFARSRLPKPGRQMVGVEDLHFHNLRHTGVSWFSKWNGVSLRRYTPLRSVKRT